MPDRIKFIKDFDWWYGGQNFPSEYCFSYVGEVEDLWQDDSIIDELVSMGVCVRIDLESGSEMID